MVFVGNTNTWSTSPAPTYLRLSATTMRATLTASDVTHNSATLNLADYSGNWHYKANKAPDKHLQGPGRHGDQGD